MTKDFDEEYITNAEYIIKDFPRIASMTAGGNSPTTVTIGEDTFKVPFKLAAPIVHMVYVYPNVLNALRESRQENAELKETFDEAINSLAETVNERDSFKYQLEESRQENVRLIEQLDLLGGND